MDKKRKKRRKFRRLSIQTFWAILSNSYISGFIQGKIYKGSLKKICVPGLNCYSCPGALGSCPIGALQAVIGSHGYKFTFYITGFLFLVGAVMGRFICGFLCPFGLIQDLLHKIPFPKKVKTFPADKYLRFLKYIILAVFVIILPMFLTDLLGQGAPYFCKLICPVGMLEGGLPLVLLNKALRKTVGFLYASKGVILVVTVLLSIVIYRPFCKYICPLGAIYSLFNPISALRYRTDKEKCIGCKECEKVCDMTCNPSINPNPAECIRCGKCKTVCPTDAIKTDCLFIRQKPTDGEMSSTKDSTGN